MSFFSSEILFFVVFECFSYWTGDNFENLCQRWKTIFFTNHLTLNLSTLGKVIRSIINPIRVSLESMPNWNPTFRAKKSHPKPKFGIIMKFGVCLVPILSTPSNQSRYSQPAPPHSWVNKYFLIISKFQCHL